MKKIIYGSILLGLMAIASLNSCKKDGTNPIPSNTSKIDMSKVTIKSGSSRSSNSILFFANQQDYDDMLDDLSVSVDNYDDAFLNQHINLTEEELDSLEDEINYDEDEPLIQFENSLGFSSMRNKLAEERAVYDELENPDPNENPDNYVIFDDFVRTLINVDGAIGIGDKIYWPQNDGAVLEVETNDVDVFYEILDEVTGGTRSSSTLTINIAHVVKGVTIRLTLDDSEDCKEDKHNAWYKEDGNKKIEWWVGVKRTVFGGTRTKIINYEKNRRGRWKKRRRSSLMSLSGENCNYYTFDPTGVDRWPNSGTKRRRKKNKKYVNDHKVKTHEIKAVFYGNGITKVKWLTF